MDVCIGNYDWLIVLQRLDPGLRRDDGVELFSFYDSLFRGNDDVRLGYGRSHVALFVNFVVKK